MENQDLKELDIEYKKLDIEPGLYDYNGQVVIYPPKAIERVWWNPFLFTAFYNLSTNYNIPIDNKEIREGKVKIWHKGVSKILVMFLRLDKID